MKADTFGIIALIILAFVLGFSVFMEDARLLGKDITSLVYIVLISVAIFIAIRVVVLWYWKIDKIVDLLTKIEENTRQKK